MTAGSGGTSAGTGGAFSSSGAAGEAGAGGSAGAPVETDDPATPGDDRAASVACGSEACDVSGATVCCYETTSEGECIEADGCYDQAGFVCDGPEDCPGDTVCCHYYDFVSHCRSQCGDQDRACHTKADCAHYETCVTSSKGYGHCRSEDVRATVGHDGSGSIFCGTNQVCSDGERCCIGVGGATCATNSCDTDALSIECDGSEDCPDGWHCRFEDGGAACSDQPTGGSEDLAFVCHEQVDDCNGYECLPRPEIASVGYCDPRTGT